MPERRDLEVVQRALEFDRSMLESVVIDKVTLIKVGVPCDLLPVVLVKHPYVFSQITLIVEAMEALTRAKLTVIIVFDFFIIFSRRCLVYP